MPAEIQNIWSVSPLFRYYAGWIPIEHQVELAQKPLEIRYGIRRDIRER